MSDAAPDLLRADKRQSAYLPWLAAPSFGHVALRLVLALAMLAALDAAIVRLCPSADFDGEYRMPRVMPTSTLAAFADHVEAASAGEAATVLFLGASPTYGQHVKRPENAFPQAFERAAAKRGAEPLEAYNLASNGQYAADEYVIAKRLADDADFVFVQLTYHTFNPKAREGRRIRYEELPALLGVGLDAEEARELGVQPRRASGFASALDAALRERWALYRERDAIAARLFGRPAEQAAHRAFMAAVGKEVVEPEDAPGGLPEEATDPDVDPGAQLVAFADYMEDASFRIDPDDEQVEFVRRLARLLHERDVPALFYIPPMNTELIESFGLLDPAEYAANTAVLREAVETQGGLWMDYNANGRRVLPPEQFADVNHTNDEGGAAFGEMLYTQYLRMTAQAGSVKR